MSQVWLSHQFKQKDDARISEKQIFTKCCIGYGKMNKIAWGKFFKLLFKIHSYISHTKSESFKGAFINDVTLEGKVSYFSTHWIGWLSSIGEYFEWPLWPVNNLWLAYYASSNRGLILLSSSIKILFPTEVLDIREIVLLMSWECTY